jgi:hypothetical protein
MTEPKKGELFSRQYIERGKPLPDKPRWRVRLAEYFGNFLRETYGEKVQKMIPTEIGVDVPWIPNHGYSVPQFLRTASIQDVLSAITLIYRSMTSWNASKMSFDKHISANIWRDFARRSLLEENLAYTIDDECGVHPLVDLEYERNIASTIASLGIARYAAARSAFEAAQGKLEQNPVDTKGAIRDIFEAAETLTKLITSSGKALDAGFVKAEVEPRLQKLYAKDAVAQRSSTRSAQSFADWIDAAHPYRHGHGAEEPVAPPLELTVLIASQGASFIRWLVDLDLQLTGGGLL